MFAIAVPAAAAEYSWEETIQATEAVVLGAYGDILEEAEWPEERAERARLISARLKEVTSPLEKAAGHYHLATCLEDQAQAKDEIRQARVVLEDAEPGPVKVCFALLLDLVEAQLFLDAGQYDAAEALYFEAIDAHPDFPTINPALAKLTSMGKKPGRAKKTIVRFHQIADRHAGTELAENALFRAAALEIYQAKDYRGARQTLARILREYPDSAKRANEMLARLPQPTLWERGRWLAGAVVLAGGGVGVLVWRRRKR